MKKVYQVVAAVLVALALTAGMVIVVWPSDPPPREVKPVAYVSFSPGISETLYALGVGERLKGVDSWSLTPMALADSLERKETTTVGTYSQPNIEAVIRLNPSAIFMESTQTVGNLWSLRSDDCQLHEIALITLADLLAANRSLGRIVGKENEGEALSAEIEQLMATPVISGAPPKVLLVIPWVQSGKTSCLGPPSYHSQVLEKFGGTNVLVGRDKPWVEINPEVAAAIETDLVIFIGPNREGAADEERNLLIKGNAAVTSGNVRSLSSPDVLVKGPLSLKLYVTELRKLLIEWDTQRRTKAG